MMEKVFAPGCALMIYKPELGKRVLKYLSENRGVSKEHLICCRHEPDLEEGTCIINTCPGCDKRYNQLYEGVTTISLWEMLAEDINFPFPDYKGKEMSIIDACPTRNKDSVHDAVRLLLEKMNIKVVEPKNTRTRSTCCGDSYYGILSIDEVKEKMKKRASEMPVEDVVVYCVSCSKSMFHGGKKPHYLVDLLFGEETIKGTVEPDEWHRDINSFIELH